LLGSIDVIRSASKNGSAVRYLVVGSLVVTHFWLFPQTGYEGVLRRSAVLVAIAVAVWLYDLYLWVKTGPIGNSD